jgi:hypothetical protein
MAWRHRPDFVSVNLYELGWMGIARAALHAGIAIEAGLAVPADAEALRGSAFAHQILRAVVAVDGGAEDASAIAELIPKDVPQLWHGSGERTWEVISAAGQLASTCASDWRTCSCCPTAAPRQTTPSWSPPQWLSSAAPTEGTPEIRA